MNRRSGKLDGTWKMNGVEFAMGKLVELHGLLENSRLSSIRSLGKSRGSGDSACGDRDASVFWR